MSKVTKQETITLYSAVPIIFAEAVKQLHEKYNCKIKKYEPYKNNWISLIVQGSRKDLEILNANCEKIAYGSTNFNTQ
jgi:hypothetical protein